MGTLDRKSTRLNSSHANIYPLSLHSALPICFFAFNSLSNQVLLVSHTNTATLSSASMIYVLNGDTRSEEHTSELQSRQYLPSFPTLRSSDLLLLFQFPVQPRLAREPHQYRHPVFRLDDLCAEWGHWRRPLPDEHGRGHHQWRAGHHQRHPRAEHYQRGR